MAIDLVQLHEHVRLGDAGDRLLTDPDMAEIRKEVLLQIFYDWLQTDTDGTAIRESLWQTTQGLGKLDSILLGLKNRGLDARAALQKESRIEVVGG